MLSTRTLLALSATAFVAACASPKCQTRRQQEPINTPRHHPAAAASAPTAAMQDRMKAMREMHDQMAQAKTPEERQALMADHMKAMQGGMQMMKGMGGMGHGRRCLHARPPGPPADIGKCQQLMEQRMDMMQMMMEMMMQRMPATPPAGR